MCSPGISCGLFPTDRLEFDGVAQMWAVAGRWRFVRAKLALVQTRQMG